MYVRTSLYVNAHCNLDNRDIVILCMTIVVLRKQSVSILYYVHILFAHNHIAYAFHNVCVGLGNTSS